MISVLVNITLGDNFEPDEDSLHFEAKINGLAVNAYRLGAITERQFFEGVLGDDQFPAFDEVYDYDGEANSLLVTYLIEAFWETVKVDPDKGLDDLLRPVPDYLGRIYN